MTRDMRLRLAFAGFHPDRRVGLVERFGSAAAVVRAITAGRLRVSARVGAAVSMTGRECRERVAAEGAGVVFRGDAGYPEHLAVLPDAPDVLFVRGRLPVRPGVAIVGTRRCTRYGLGVARAYGAAAGRAGWCVVSGLARGIDGAAHRGVVDVGGIGVGVLGCVIDVAYPGEHRSLADALVEGGGALVTEYLPGTPPEGWRFPPRNRIISGLVSVVVVVEAAERGGALVTAAAALDQARVVLAVPGDVDRVSSRGCNLLIRDGAVPVLDPADLVEAVSLVLGPPHVGRIGGMGDVPVGGLTRWCWTQRWCRVPVLRRSSSDAVFL